MLWHHTEAVGSVAKFLIMVPVPPSGSCGADGDVHELLLAKESDTLGVRQVLEPSIDRGNLLDVQELVFVNFHPRNFITDISVVVWNLN